MNYQFNNMKNILSLQNLNIEFLKFEKKDNTFLKLSLENVNNAYFNSNYEEEEEGEEINEDNLFKEQSNIQK